MAANPKSYLLILFLSSASLLSACNGGNDKDLQAYVDKLMASKAVKVNHDPLGGLTLPAPVTYKADALRQPFEMAQIVTSVGKVSPNADPLQAYPLTMLRFVGTMAKDKVIYAFIVTPDNSVFQVKQGDVIGDRYGKVVSINADKLNVMEQTSENGQASIQHVVTMQLKEEQQ